MEKRIREVFEEDIALYQKALAGDVPSAVQSATDLILVSLKAGGKLLIAGNGGSAADAQHFAAELVGKYLKERPAISAIALTTDTSILTAWSNDFSFDSVFARQIQAHGKKGDVFFGISTSGNSKNIIEAVAKAKKHGLKTVLLLGGTGGQMKGTGDVEILVPSATTPRIQEVHTSIIHIISELVEAGI